MGTKFSFYHNPNLFDNKSNRTSEIFFKIIMAAIALATFVLCRVDVVVLFVKVQWTNKCVQLP